MENSVLIYTQNKKIKDADATLNLTRNIFDELTLKQKNVMQAISEGDIKLEGNKQKLDEFMSLFDTFATMFNIITTN